MSNLSSLPLLQDFPVEVLRLIIHHVVDSRNGILDERILQTAKDAYALSCNNSWIFHVFKTSFHSLFLDGTPDINPEAVARLFGPSLRRVTLHNFSYTNVFLRCLAQRCPRLESLAISTERNDVLCPRVFSLVLQSASSTLRALHLKGKIRGGKVNFNVFRKHFSNLTSLSLGSLVSLTHTELLHLLAAPSIRLRHLTLNNLYHNTITNFTLSRIAELCPSLSRVSLYAMKHCSDEGAKCMALSLRNSLRHMEFDLMNGVRASESDLAALTAACHGLSHLTFCCTDEISKSAFSAFTSAGASLRSLCLYNLKELSANDIDRLYPMLSGLRELQLLYSINSKRVADLLDGIGSQLESLVIGVHYPSDAIMYAIASCTQLRKLEISSCKFLLDRHADFPSENSVDDMISNVGAELREFTWDFSSHWDPLRRHTDFGRLSGSSLINSLVSYCKKLTVVNIRGLLELGICYNEDAASITKLEKNLPEAELYIERNKPFWFDPYEEAS